MKSKECNTVSLISPAVTAVVLAALAVPAVGDAATVRLWPTAVVTGDEVTLGDICDLNELEPNLREKLASQPVSIAPPPGGSATVLASEVHAALRAGGANLATVALSGATRSVLTRPRTLSATDAAVSPASRRTGSVSSHTLGDAVRDVFARAARLCGGASDLQFGRTPEHVLDLRGPEFTFDVNVRGGRRIGRMIPVDVDVRKDGAPVQTVHLVVNALLRKPTVVAARAINQKATVRRDDVELVDRLYDRAEDATQTFAGPESIAAVVGQRARRFIPTDAPIQPDDLEAVPLVQRGQLVEVTSRSGGVAVRSVAHAVTAGGLGDAVELRVNGRRGATLFATVIGEHRVAIGERRQFAEPWNEALASGVRHGN